MTIIRSGGASPQAFVFLTIVRLASVYIVQTFFVPDEYWQSLEVAHKLTFGYGYLTWEWVQGIRSYVYPLTIAAVYKLLAFFALDTRWLLITLPRILQALLTAYSDYRFYIWTGKKKWALFLISIPWFWFYTGSRTLSNTLETSLTTIALSYFPWNGEGVTYLWFAAFCCFLRPTAAVIWIPLCVYHLHKSRLPTKELILKQYLFIGLLVAGICIGVDSYWHGKFIVTPYEFFKYNIFHNIGSFYGSHPWYWYFTVGLPTVLGITTVPFIFGVAETVRNLSIYPVRKQLLIIILLSLIVLSTVEHKEFRFITSLLPFCLYITSDTLTRWSYKASRILLWFTALALLIGNALPAWYLSTVHQRTPLQLLESMDEIIRAWDNENKSTPPSFIFLMPCHSTPYYSHVHKNFTMRFLTCEPNLQNLPNYKDEAEQFFESPTHWLRSHIPIHPRSAMPTHVIIYESLAPRITEFLIKYELAYEIKNLELSVNRDIQFLLDEWVILLREKKININSILEHVQRKTGRNILVYRIVPEHEENAFNRNERLTTPPDDYSNIEEVKREINGGNMFN